MKLLEAMDDLTKQWADKGCVIEGGWVALRRFVISKDAPPEQLHEMRMAYFAGAQHLFSSILAILDSEREPTAADIKRVTAIDAELRAFANEMASKGAPAQDLSQ